MDSRFCVCHSVLSLSWASKACGSIRDLREILAPSIVLRRVAPIIGVVVCFGGMSVSQAEAQVSGPLTSSDTRTLIKGCFGGGGASRCVGALFRIGDLILGTLQAPPQQTANESPTRRVVWDGTFPQPNAPSFYALSKLYVPDRAQSSAQVCAQLPDRLKTDKTLLLKLTCQAERELLAAGTDQWKDERVELEEIRKLLSACLPPQTSSNPCAAP